MMFREFLYAIWRDWGSLITGGASVPLIVLAFFANTPTQKAVWAVFAIACFGYASFRVWAAEYCRAETAEGKLITLPRPWVVIDGYESSWAEDAETREEYLIETLHIVNRGDVAAVSIAIPSIKSYNRTARLLSPLPTLGPGESTETRILNLRHVMEAVKMNTPTVLGQSWSARLNLTITYRDPSHAHWETTQEVVYTVMGISFGILHSAEPRESRMG
jgi:hypothetical protein